MKFKNWTVTDTALDYVDGAMTYSVPIVKERMFMRHLGEFYLTPIEAGSVKTIKPVHVFDLWKAFCFAAQQKGYFIDPAIEKKTYLKLKELILKRLEDEHRLPSEPTPTPEPPKPEPPKPTTPTKKLNLPTPEPGITWAPGDPKRGKF